MPAARYRSSALLVDSTGLKLGGAGEWLLEKHDTSRRRSRRKLHIGIDAESGEIVAMELRINLSAAALFPLGLDQDVQNLSFAIDGAPDIDQASIDLQIDLVEMPDRVRSWSTVAQICSDLWPEMIDPSCHGLMRDHDPPRSASKSSTSRKLKVNLAYS